MSSVIRFDSPRMRFHLGYLDGAEDERGNADPADRDQDYGQAYDEGYWLGRKDLRDGAFTGDSHDAWARLRCDNPATPSQIDMGTTHQMGYCLALLNRIIDQEGLHSTTYREACEEFIELSAHFGDTPDDRIWSDFLTHYSAMIGDAPAYDINFDDPPGFDF